MGSIQAIIAAEMEAPPDPMRSPDGLWWWDGRAWQPIATLSVPPTLPLAPSPAARSAAPDPAPPAADVWQSPATVPAAGGGTWTPPPVEVWQPPPAASAPPVGAWQPPGAISEIVPNAELPLAPATPPPPPAAPPVAAATPPTVVPPPPPPPPEPQKEEIKWPTWLPQTPAAEAVVQGIPARVEHAAAATPPPPPSPSAAPAPRPLVGIPGEGGVSSWATQFYPTVGKLTSNRQVLIWAGVAVLGLVAIYVIFQVVANSNLFGGNGSGTPPDLGPSGTQAQQADAFLGSLNPALDSTASAYRPIAVDCGGTFSVTCRSTLEDADTATVKAIAVLDTKPFPSCLVTNAVQTRHDLVDIEQALRTAVIGFHSSSDDLKVKGLKDFNALAPALKADQDAIKAAGQTSCPKGP